MERVGEAGGRVMVGRGIWGMQRTGGGVGVGCYGGARFRNRDNRVECGSGLVGSKATSARFPFSTFAAAAPKFTDVASPTDSLEGKGWSGIARCVRGVG